MSQVVREVLVAVLGALGRQKGLTTLLVVAAALVYAFWRNRRHNRHRTPDSPEEQLRRQQQHQFFRNNQNLHQQQQLQRGPGGSAAVGPERFLIPRGPASKLKVAVSLQALLGPVDSRFGVPMSEAELAAQELPSEVAEVLQLLLRCCDVYLVVLLTEGVDPQLGRDLVETMLISAGLAEGLLPPHRILCCTTHKGQVAVFRQLDAHLTVTASSGDAEEIVAHLPEVVLVGSVAVPVPKLKCLPGFANYFQLTPARRGPASGANGGGAAGSGSSSSGAALLSSSEVKLRRPGVAAAAQP